MKYFLSEKYRGKKSVKNNLTMGGGEMSGHIPCICKDKRNWRVIHRNHNHSSFESPPYAEHRSDYSLILCFDEGCNGNFRSKADYVYSIPDISGKEEKLWLSSKLVLKEGKIK